MWLYIFFIIILILLFSFALSGLSLAPWVPAWKKDLKRIFKLAGLQAGEVFYDLGCGDGRTVFYAAKHFNAKAIGIELSLPMYFICRLKQVFYKSKKTNFKFRNLFKQNLSDADVVYFFGLPKIIKNRLRQKLEQELMPGARVVSYAFTIPGWEAKIMDKPRKKDVAVYLYER